MPRKSELLLKLEAKIDPDTVIFPKSVKNFCLIVDVMYVCRLLKWKKLLTFYDFGTCFCQYVYHQLTDQVKRIDFIFDSYLQYSIKSGEHLCRYGEESIELHKITNETPMPVQEKLFWSSGNNKTLLQNYLRSYILLYGKFIWPNVELICSGTIDHSCQSNFSEHEDSQRLHPLQRKDIEEADTRILVHVHHAVVAYKCVHVFILTTDTDILVLALHFFHGFQNSGLQVSTLESIFNLV